MLEKTIEIKQKMQKLDSIEERLELMHNAYKDDTAYVLTCGPSLNDYTKEELKEKLKDKLVLCIKHSIEAVYDICDYHLLNLWNFEFPYNYTNPNTIVFYGLAKSFLREHLQKASEYPLDLWVPVSNPPYTQKHQTTCATRNFENLKSLSKTTELIWGPGMMTEMGLSTAVHLGCKKIVTIGWDLGNPNERWGSYQHYIPNEQYRELYDRPDATVPMPGELEEGIAATKEMHEWFIKENIEFNIISDRNPSDSRIKRLKFKDI